jgi:hypothetical protein
MSFYEGSKLTLAWNAQHGCGGNNYDDPHNLDCNFVIQYTCNTDNTKITDKAFQVNIRNGGNTNIPDAETATYANVAGKVTSNDNNQRGRHENEYSYFECANRGRNKGLFTADQKLNGDTAKYTRQNPNGGRSGLECPEERDYYPYWAPTIWRDIAYLTSETKNTNVDVCNVVKTESQNVKDKYRCTSATPTAATLAPITEEECTTAGGTWTKTDKFGIAAPECLEAGWSRDNHLGNTREGDYQNYTWTVPSWTELTNTNKFAAEGQYVSCNIRIRYNITTADYDPWNTFSTSNNEPSVISQNPTLDLGADRQGLQLALNTAQTGRTFQDRTHMITIKKRPTALNNKVIKNLNTIGKRGNIVQTFPSVEYYFMPRNLVVTTEEYVHIQWTGSNTHNNGNPGGDGQTGDDGQGQGGTDRNNFVLTRSEGENFPVALDKADEHMWKYTTCYIPQPDGTLDTLSKDGAANFSIDCALIFATSGQIRTIAEATAAINAQLNDAPASLIGGVLIKVSKPGRYTFMSSRNNNFTNRSQKGVLTVVQA